MIVSREPRCVEAREAREYGMSFSTLRLREKGVPDDVVNELTLLSLDRQRKSAAIRSGIVRNRKDLQGAFEAVLNLKAAGQLSEQETKDAMECLLFARQYRAFGYSYKTILRWATRRSKGESGDSRRHKPGRRGVAQYPLRLSKTWAEE